MSVIQFHLNDRSPFDQKFVISNGATLPKLRVQVLENSIPVDFTGATIIFSMEDRDGALKVTAQTATLVDALDGLIEYPWASGDTDLEKDFFGQFVVTVGSDTFLIPNNETQRLIITVGPKVN